MRFVISIMQRPLFSGANVLQTTGKTRFLRLFSQVSNQNTSKPADSLQDLPKWTKPLSCRPAKRQPKSPKQKLQKTLSAYYELAKPKLSALVVLSAMSSYALAPAGGSLHELAFLTAGTTLCSASANAINQGREPEFDRQMARTRTRPVASYRLTSQQAYKFAALAGLAGVSTLYWGTNPTVAALGLLNIYLYGGTYTSMKRTSVANTWVGAVVGAIPPLMGWATCATLYSPEPWILAGLLYSWQFPHFMSLSYSIGEEYKRAGYVMAGWTNPKLASRVALRHAIAMFPLCFAAAYFGITDMYFAIDSSILNAWQTWAAYKFWQQQRRSGGKNYARILFLVSVVHLPGILVLAMLHKKNQWNWLSEWYEGKRTEN